MSIPVVDIDPYGTEYLSDPLPAWGRMRDAGPVVALEKYGVLACARYAEVRSTVENWKDFSSARGTGLADFKTEEAWRPRSITLETDPPDHTRTRRVMARVLSPGAINALRPRFEQDADDLVGSLVEKGEIDAIADLAEAYPLEVFPDAFGMPRENRQFLLPYGNMAFNSFGPRNQLLEDSIRDAEPVVEWMHEQMTRKALTPDGLGGGIHASADSGELTEEEASKVARAVLTAGVDTTVNGIGAAVYCLASFPGQFERLRQDPSLARAAFDEAVRYETPVNTMYRTTSRDVELGGEAVPEGRKILMFYGSANRDPRRWDNPDDYDISRKTQGHVGFGGGIHACVGMGLARLEGDCILTALARRVRSIEILEQPKRRFNNVLRGLSSLKVRLQAA